jgi:hypothetical protein
MYTRWLLFAFTPMAIVASDGSVQALFTTVREAIQNQQTDASIAARISKARLFESLEYRVIEELETEGAGPYTIAELDRQRALTRNLPRAATQLFEVPAAPSEEQKTAVIERVREVALEYSSKLPNFICTETVRRFVDRRHTETWSIRDKLTITVSFSGNHEDYKLLAVNDRRTSQALEDVLGSTSKGEFGSELRNIFRPESAAEFRWERWTRLRGRQTHVFSFRIDRRHSPLSVRFRSGREQSLVNPGITGFVYIDDETCQVLRIMSEPDSLPATQRIVRAPSILDYDFVHIGRDVFLLPRRAEVRVTLRQRGQTRNVMEFENYRRFSSDAALKFSQ